jgi:citrate lyase subunit beta/citryl-CoA lyase
MPEPFSPPIAAPRSYLFVPGDRPERFDKAWASPADDVILDLEDAVPPERRDTARAAVADWLRAERPVWVRCNATDSDWFPHELALAGRPGLAGFVLPKAEELPAALLDRCGDHGLGLIPLIETAQGIARCEALARSPAVRRLAFGSIDFQADLGIEGEDDGLLHFRSRLVLASRLAGRPAPIDGVTPAIDDEARVREDTRRARRLGLKARLCIHPRQVPWVHEELAPSIGERDWARRVIEAMASARGAAVAVDGKMVDRPVWLRAREIDAAPAASGRMRA